MTEFDDFFSRHQRVMLQFSAGKDSAAVLWLLEPYWDRLDVVWANPGNPYPETLEYMEGIAKLVPHFFSVLGAQPSDIQQNGWPVDTVPMGATQIGMLISGQPGLRLRPFWECCGRNMWQPVANAVKQGDYSGIIRGQKLADRLKGPLASGMIVDGVEYLHPIETWTDAEVINFLGEERLPPSYKRGLPSSLDCMNCTAYAAENAGRILDLRGVDEKAWREVTAVHLHLLDLLSAYAEDIRSCHG